MARSDDDFKAFGLPIMLLVIFAATIFLSRKQLIHTWTMAQFSTSLMILFWGSITCGGLSIFLYFTAAWGYGLISTALCYSLALVAAGVGVQARVKFLMWTISMWFAILIGIPTPLAGFGIITVISSQCITYYNTAQDAMCKTGWLAFAEISATFVIGLTFMSLLTLLNFAFISDTSEGSYVPVADSPVHNNESNTHGYGSPSGHSNTDYQKLA